MKNLFFILLFSIATFSGISQCESSFPYWLEGRWIVTPQESNSYEEWELIDNNTMSGMTYKEYENNKLILDKMSIKCKDDSAIMQMVAIKDSTKFLADFVLETDNDSYWKFYNDLTDFPCKITYQKINNDSIDVQIEGRIEEQVKMKVLLIRQKE